MSSETQHSFRPSADDAKEVLFKDLEPNDTALVGLLLCTVGGGIIVMSALSLWRMDSLGHGLLSLIVFAGFMLLIAEYLCGASHMVIAAFKGGLTKRYQDGVEAACQKAAQTSATDQHIEQYGIQEVPDEIAD